MNPDPKRIAMWSGPRNLTTALMYAFAARGDCAVWDEPFYAAYAAASGQQVDAEEVRWWEIFGFVRWMVLNIMQAHGHWSEERRSPAFAACGRNTCLIEYEMLMSLLGHYA